MPRASNTFDDFLNPKSMLTPGLAGSMTMVITNALVTQFGASPAYTALIISALFGIVVFAATAAALWLRGVLYVLNSLLIFSVALGANRLGAMTELRGSRACGNAFQNPRRGTCMHRRFHGHASAGALTALNCKQLCRIRIFRFPLSPQSSRLE